MNSKIISSFLIFTLILVIPQANAQFNWFRSKTKSVEVTINDTGNVDVKHHS